MASGGAVLMTDRLERVPLRLKPDCNCLAGVHVGRPCNNRWCVVFYLLSDCSKLFVFNCVSVRLNLLGAGASEQLDLNYSSSQLLRFYYVLRNVLCSDVTPNILLSHAPLYFYSQQSVKEKGIEGDTVSMQ